MVENPYNYNLPIEEASLFFGRQGQAADMFRHLTATRGDSYGLVGGRRMGKTSLLRQLARECHTMQADTHASLLPIPLNFDFTGDIITTPADFFEQAIQRMHTALAELLDRLAPLPPPPASSWRERWRQRLTGPAPQPTWLEQLPPDWGEATLPPGPTLVALLEKWGQQVETAVARTPRFILLLDEAERLVHQPWAGELQAALRYVLVDGRASNYLKIVLAGSHGFRTQLMVKGSPLENVLKYEFLYNFPQGAVEALATQPHRRPCAPAVQQAVWDLGGGHPFLTQYLLHGLWEAGWEGATREKVQQVGQRFTLERHDFADWLGHLGENTAVEAYQVLLAHAPQPLIEQEWQRNTAVGDFRALVNGLRYHGLVRWDEHTQGYTPAGQLFTAWFVTYAQTTNNPHPSATAPTPEETVELRQMREAMCDGLSLHEVQTIIFDLSAELGVSAAELPHDNTANLVLALLAHCQRRGKVAVLVAHLHANYPHLGV